MIPDPCESLRDELHRLCWEIDPKLFDEPSDSKRMVDGAIEILKQRKATNADRKALVEKTTRRTPA